MAGTKRQVPFEPESIDKHEQSIAAKGVCKRNLSVICFIAILKKGEGLGGKATSLLKPKDKP